MPMALGLGLGISFVQNSVGKPVADTLCQAIATQVMITAIYDGVAITFAPLIVYELEGVSYVDGILEEDLPALGNRPPAITSLEVSALSAVSPTQTAFTIHPRIVPLLRRYQNVKCVVSAIQSGQDLG
ncbi:MULTISPECIES: hypothetical protein [unclassified Rhizobium]|uniref:hypothetical protein n=1 Tax=unclassified Rhizobium TaxID=2613769 RepID=UPI0021A92106|nr:MULTISPECIES: hypothetical protein [Rhizobium]MDU0310402.1 hypothetical protein [Rhizobium sp. 10PS4]UWM82571.1 hypothetical protein N2A41_04705 [Rhizobium leguminosarum bv. viciae]